MLHVIHTDNRIYAISYYIIYNIYYSLSVFYMYDISHIFQRERERLHKRLCVCAYVHALVCMYSAGLGILLP